jgi:hypothetical protein
MAKNTSKNKFKNRKILKFNVPLTGIHSMRR